MVNVTDITVKFGENTVLRSVSCEVQHGELVAIMGSSGGGKTTLLRCIAGLIQPVAGKVTVDGTNVEDEPEAARRKMGMVFQSAALFDFLTVEENVAFGLRRWSEDSKEKQKKQVHNVLERVGLLEAAQKLPGELSGGMKKRVGVARAIVLNPKVMLYDEPTTGLDPITTYSIDELMRGLCVNSDMTSLVVSHDLSSVLRIADRIGFLHKGEIVYFGGTDGFLKSTHEAIQEVVSKSQATHLSVK